MISVAPEILLPQGITSNQLSSEDSVRKRCFVSKCSLENVSRGPKTASGARTCCSVPKHKTVSGSIQRLHVLGPSYTTTTIPKPSAAKLVLLCPSRLDSTVRHDQRGPSHHNFLLQPQASSSFIGSWPNKSSRWGLRIRIDYQEPCTANTVFLLQSHAEQLNSTNGNFFETLWMI